MPKRSAGGDFSGACAAVRPCRRRQQKLYLVLDDWLWLWGYSIRKVDLLDDSGGPSDSDGDDGQQAQEHERLPPAILRLEAPRNYPGFFAAFGTKIMATHHTRRRGAPMFDVRSRTLNFGPRNTVVAKKNATVNVSLEAAGRLFLMSKVCFEALDPPPPPAPSRDYLLHSDPKPKNWKWRLLPTPPFLGTGSRDIYTLAVAHAVHPDGQTFFFSSSKYGRNVESGTFSFDIARSAWASHGAWRLPFDGRGYFDPDLDSWVGLPGLLDESPDTLGHLCASQVPGAAADDDDGPPAWKLSKEKLFCTDPTEEHIGATLVYLGGGSRFCVVQRLRVREGKRRRSSRKKRSKVQLLRIITFYLKYDMNGDLRAVTYGRVRSYKLPETAYEYQGAMENPVAFWM